MQLGIALQSYESSHELLPPGVVTDTGPVLDQPKGYHFGWLAQILPYFELRNVYNHFNFNVGLYELQNLTTRDDSGPQLPLPLGSGPDSRARRCRDDELCRLAQRCRGADRGQ